MVSSKSDKRASRSYRRRYTLREATYPPNNVTADADLDDNNHRKSIALLIAGQCHRFIYRDESGPLFQTSTANASSSSSSNKNSTIYHNYDIDVYIALQCGDVVPSYVGTVDTPPYMRHRSDDDIATWYFQRGARSVTLQIIDTATMDGIYHDVTRQATVPVAHWPDFNLSLVPAWPAEARKFYLRHYVFGMAQESLSSSTAYYDAYVFNREDNLYLKALDLQEHFFSKNQSTASGSGSTTSMTMTPFVIVDANCEWRAYSDKMYIANHDGAALLLSSTKAEFMSSLQRLMLLGLFQKNHSFWNPWQAESFVQDTLLGIAHVERVDLHRMDVRYNKGVKCVHTAYFACMSAATKRLAREQNPLPCNQAMAAIATAVDKKRSERDWIFFDRLPS